jgi:KTSC domain
MPSTAIEAIGYDDAVAELSVTFVSGKTYCYYRVPRGIYMRFRRATSKGTFFNDHIRDRYDFALASAA